VANGGKVPCRMEVRVVNWPEDGALINSEYLPSCLLTKRSVNLPAILYPMMLYFALLHYRLFALPPYCLFTLLPFCLVVPLYTKYINKPPIRLSQKVH